MRATEREALRSEVAPLLRRKIPGLRAVYLFGSSAQGTEHAGSDVDLAVWAEAPLSAPLRFGLAQACARRLHREVDLVDLATASTALAAQVVGGGELIFAREPVVVAEFEVAVLAKYCHLNEERRDLIADIQRRGAIYGG